MARLVGYSLIADAYDFSDVPAALDEAERMGVDCVELPLFALHLVADGRPVTARVDRLAALLAGRRLKTSAHGFIDVNPMADAAEAPLHRRAAEAMIAIAGAFGCRHVVFHAGRHRPEADVPDAYRRQREMLARLGDAAQAAGVVVAVENVFSHGGLETPAPSRLARELLALGHPAVAACLDIGHAAITAAEGGLDLAAELAALAPLAPHVHVHDNFARPRSRAFFHPSEALAFGEGDLHLAPGQGNLPLGRLLHDSGLGDTAWLMMELNGLRWADLAEGLAHIRSACGSQHSHFTQGLQRQ